MSALRSLRHEYELYVEREIEEYKDTISRTALLSIGDEAVARLREQPQTTLTEIVLWEEVDRLIARRLRLPTYRAWRQRRLKMLAEYRRPERWGLVPTSARARELAQGDGNHVLVAGVESEGAALYSAAHGCDVTALAREPGAVERVIVAAEAAGFGERVRGCVGDLAQWAPDVALRVVLCTPAAFHNLSPSERVVAIELLQRATLGGGVHLLEPLVTGPAALSVDELCHRYDGWSISVEPDGSQGPTFLARKSSLAH
jgi:hypothetical protein